jgi:IS30 family transposase
MARGELIIDAAAQAGTYRKQGTRWLFEVGGVRPRRGRNVQGRCLTLVQREEIALGRARGESVRQIAKQLGRSPSTVSRELRRNTDVLGRYRATTAHALAYQRASRPKPAKLLDNQVLRGIVEADLAKKYSPQQISDPSTDFTYLTFGGVRWSRVLRKNQAESTRRSAPRIPAIHNHVARLPWESRACQFSSRRRHRLAEIR